MAGGGRRREHDWVAACLTPEEFNRLVDSLSATRAKGRLRFWQERLLRRVAENTGIEVATVEQFVRLFKGAERVPVPPTRMTREEFLADPVPYQWNAAEVPFEWFVEAWRTVAPFRESLVDMLRRSVSKLGFFDDKHLLATLARFLAREEVVALFIEIREHIGWEQDWRGQFEQAFAEHVAALPPRWPEPEYPADGGDQESPPDHWDDDIPF